MQPAWPLIVSAAIFFPLSVWLAGAYGNHGLWASVHALFIIRAATLLVAYPAMERGVGPGGN